MSDQNPFDQPPSNPSPNPPFNSSLNAPLSPPPGDWGPVTPYNPIGERQGGPGRGKIAVVALAAAALTGGAIFGISQFADAEDPVLEDANVAFDIPVVTQPSSAGPGSENIGQASTPVPSVPGGIGDIADCLNIDLDEILGSLPTGEPGGGTMPNIDFSAGGDTVTITGSDGVTVYSFGEGDGSIAISKSGGELTVAVGGDVVESTSFQFDEFQAEMDDMMAELEAMDLENMNPGDFNIEEILEELDLGNLTIGGTSVSVPAMPIPADFDADAITECFEQLDMNMPMSGG
ncbi:MAG TPA: hypothetical protein VMM60_06350 [Ilumatobacter sp.]|nr:hypothetical protein [Ilumatobacter sp.]